MLDNHRGIALFMVLWILALLSVIVAEFSAAMRTEVNITRNFKEEAVAYYIARAGVDIAIRKLVQGGNAAPAADGAVENEPEFRLNAPITIPFGQGTIELEIQNEAGKININRASQRLLTQMLSPFDLTDEEKAVIVDSIMDWRDKDSFHRLNGAEAAYYQKLTPPYVPRNNDFESIEELLKVRGISKEIFYGGLKEMLTLYPKSEPEREYIEENTDDPDDPPKKWYRLDENRIDLNAAAVETLRALPSMTENAIDAIVAHRRQAEFTAVTELASLVEENVYNDSILFLTLENSPFYTIRSTGNLPGSASNRTVRVLVEIASHFKGRYRILQWWDDAESGGITL